MTRYAEAMAEVVHQHGGTVERFRGDEVMAVFGVPTAHEDDALRAVRAATEMQRRLAHLNAELLEAWGVELTCRIGINTGEVVAGDPTTRETFVTGDAVNLAKRLEQAAEPGTILIGTATYPLVKDAVKVGPRERFTAKGKEEGVARFRLDEVDTAASGYARRLDAPLVGRAEELESLRSLVDKAFEERRCRVVMLLGTAGVGKSRLARELASGLEDVADVATGRCLPYGTGVTFWPLQQLVTDLGGIEAVAAFLAETEDGDVVLERLRAATGAAEGAAPSTEVFWAVRRLLERVAERRPLLVVFEDLHWAEPTMLDLVEYIAAFARGPIALLCISRPELLETRPTLAAVRLELEQLSDAEIEELVEALGIDDADLLERITSTSEGNPLFAEQLAAMIADSNPGDAVELPASIHALLAARIDSLDPAERRTLERASIVGKEFWPRAIVDLSTHADQPHVTGQLMSLVRKGLVKPARSELPGEDAYRFRHSLICDEAYAGMPKAVRAELHERFARWLQSQARDGKGFGEHDEILGYHLEQAYRYRTELVPADESGRALAEEAGTVLASAARRALGREDMPAAVGLLERSLALLPDDDRTSRRSSDGAWRRGYPGGRVGTRSGAARRSDHVVGTRGRPPVRAPGNDRAAVAALVHRACNGHRGESARRRGCDPRTGRDRRPFRACEGMVASQRGARDCVSVGGASRGSREGDSACTPVPRRSPASWSPRPVRPSPLPRPDAGLESSACLLGPSRRRPGGADLRGRH